MMRVGGPFSSKENWVYVVRCKDCKYWAELTFLVPPKHHCGRLLQQYKGISERVSFETDADDFCSRGERAE